MLRVLAEPICSAVVRRLLLGPGHVARLNSAVGVEQSLLSHHLKVLREARLVEAVREGRAVRYRLSPSFVAGDERQTIDLGCCRLIFGDAAESEKETGE